MSCLIEGFNNDRLLKAILLGLLQVVPFRNTFQILRPIDFTLGTEDHCLLNDFQGVVFEKPFDYP